jgi:hypothetical protein
MWNQLEPADLFTGFAVGLYLVVLLVYTWRHVDQEAKIRRQEWVIYRMQVELEARGVKTVVHKEGGLLDAVSFLDTTDAEDAEYWEELWGA